MLNTHDSQIISVTERQYRNQLKLYGFGNVRLMTSV